MSDSLGNFVPNSLLGEGKLADFFDENIAERIFCLGLGGGGSNHGFKRGNMCSYIILDRFQRLDIILLS